MFKTSMDVVRKRHQQILRQKEEIEGRKFFDKFTPGANTRRILPPWSSEGNWRKEGVYHYLFDENVICPKMTFDQPCPICEERAVLYKTGNPEDKELAGKLKPRWRYFANVLNLEKNDGKVYVMGFGQKLEKDFVSKMDGTASTTGDVFAYGDITDVKAGRNVQITVTVPVKIINGIPTPIKMETEYKLEVSQVVTPLPNAEEICKNLHNLDEIIQKDTRTYEQLCGLLSGQPTTSAPGGPPPQTPPPVTAPVQESPSTSLKVSGEFDRPPAVVVTPATAAAPIVLSQVSAPVVVQPVAAPAPAAPVQAAPDAGSALERLKARRKAAGK